MNILYCAIDSDEFNHIFTCKPAKEIWDTLELTHEGTDLVKESKINILVHNYELFKMKSDESITETFTRFTDIINGFKSLRNVYPNNEQVRKIFRSLPKSWEAKVTANQEANDLNTLPLEELLGSLVTYELTQKQHSQDEDNEKIAFIIQKFKRFMKHKWRGGKKYEAKRDSSKESTIICYECKKSDYIKAKCPLTKKRGNKEKRKRAMAAMT